MTQPYPHLGFNPAPGNVGTVSALTAKLEKSAQVISQAHRMIEKLRAGTSWEGDAAVAFREELDGALPANLRNAHTSISKAAEALGSWQQALEGYQERATSLDGEAKRAQDKIHTVEGREKTAEGNPDLKLAGKEFTDQAALRDAQNRLDKATEELTNARQAVSDAKSAYSVVIRRARELETAHSSDARGHARTLRDATDKLAPDEPNWFEKAMDWVGDNLTDILGAIAAIAGLCALFFAVPVGPILLLVAAAASAATLMTRISDPVFRASIMDGFTKGEFDADFWNNAVGAAGDILGAVPGLAAVSRGGVGALKAASHGSEALTLGQKLTSAGEKTWLVANRIHAAENPLTTYVVKGARNPEKAAKVLDASIAGAGVTTGTYGVAKDLWDGFNKPAVVNTATAMDGTRAATFDGAGQGAIGLKTLKLLFT